jgi:hypothetical protein
VLLPEAEVTAAEAVAAITAVATPVDDYWTKKGEYEMDTRDPAIEFPILRRYAHPVLS